MILVDTSVWVDHFRRGDEKLVSLLEDRQVLGHPWVTGELALGSASRRDELTRLLGDLPQAPVATDVEVLSMIDRRQLGGRGIGYVDAHLLASAMLAVGAQLWTRDKRLLPVARNLRVGYLG